MTESTWRRWKPDEVLALKQLYLGARKQGDIKAFARMLNRLPSEVTRKWRELKDAHRPCAAMLDDGPGALSYRERATTLLAEPAPPQKFLCGRGGL